MACPIHVWAPLMAAAIPAARYARQRLGLARDVRRAEREAREGRTEPAEMKRWAPVGSRADTAE